MLFAETQRFFVFFLRRYIHAVNKDSRHVTMRVKDRLIHEIDEYSRWVHIGFAANRNGDALTNIRLAGSIHLVEYFQKGAALNALSLDLGKSFANRLPYQRPLTNELDVGRIDAFEHVLRSTKD